jgi:hypothetical protein
LHFVHWTLLSTDYLNQFFLIIFRNLDLMQLGGGNLIYHEKQRRLLK